MASVSVTSAAMRTVRPMMAGIGASKRAPKLVSENWCCRLLVKGFTRPKGRDEHHHERRQVDDEEPGERG